MSMISRMGFAFMLLMAAIGFQAVAEEGDDILGLWTTEEGKGRVEVVKVDGKYFGKIVWLKEPLYEAGDPEAGKPKRDRYNPDPAKRNQLDIGLQVLADFEYVGKNSWKHGTIYDVENGKTYSCKISMEDDGSLKLRGYIGISMIGRTSVWTRYAEAGGADGKQAEGATAPGGGEKK